MSFIDEITDFLTGHDISCRHETVSGIRALSVHIGNGKTRYILPVAVRASSIDEAETTAAEIRNLISHLEDISGSYPLIITEDRWHSQKSMIQKRLLAHLERFVQIYARNCEVRKIDKLTAAGFLSENHSYGDASCRYRYGLFLKRHTGHNAGSGQVPEGTLVAVATFSNARKWIKGDRSIRSYEWTRYASLPEVRLSGGMGKILNAFIDDVQPDDIMTYADLEWSEGKVYETLGFTLEGFKEPVMFSVDKEIWKRQAMSSPDIVSPDRVCFQNFGSNKYRMKLTEYQ